MKAALAALSLLALAIPAAARAQRAETWDYWTQARMETLVKENGGRVTETRHDGGETQMVTEWGQGNFAVVTGENCRGTGAQTQCRVAIVSVSFPLGDAAKAKAAAEAIDLAFIAEAVTDEGDYVILRYIELGGGVSKENVRYNLMGFIEVVGTVAPQVLPPAPAAP